MNLIFSTTRQWNPGDEFILMGVRHLFDSLDISYNPVIYNRNPDVRAMSNERQLFKASRIPDDHWRSEEMMYAEANLKFGFFDNSLKPDADGSFADAVVLAGTPEWCNARMFDLYRTIRKFHLPLLILGVGGGFRPHRREFVDVIRQAKALIVRDEDTYSEVSSAGLDATYLPCPALLSAPKAHERNIESVRRIGLVYQGTVAETVIWNGCSTDTYRYLRQLLDALVARHRQRIDFEVVCHYADEIPLAMRDFPGLPVRYSFDAADYFGIYHRYDLVVGSRVHGIGVSASMGIPGVALVHDTRGVTCKGFLADLITADMAVADAIALIEGALAEAPARNAVLLRHKEATLAAYQPIVRAALADLPVRYTGPELPPPRSFDLRGIAKKLYILKLLDADWR